MKDYFFLIILLLVCHGSCFFLFFMKYFNNIFTQRLKFPLFYFWKSFFHIDIIPSKNKVQNCDNYQIPNVNFGDSISICDDIESSKKQQWLDKGYQKLSESKTATLDSALEAGIFPRKVDIMKMDVEGYEPRVLAGASKFLNSEYAPDKIIMESRTDLLDMAGGSGGGEVRRSFFFDMFGFEKTVLYFGLVILI